MTEPLPNSTKALQTRLDGAADLQLTIFQELDS
jgi:hypothetical protein